MRKGQLNQAEGLGRGLRRLPIEAMLGQGLNDQQQRDRQETGCRLGEIF